MSKDKILLEIKKAEQSASAMIEKGLSEKNERIVAARAETREIIKQAEDDAYKSAKSVLNSAELDIRKKAEEIISSGMKEAETIRKDADANIDKAVERLVTEFERGINV